MTPEEIRDAVEIAEEQAMELVEAAAEIMAPGGLAYDQDRLTDAEFVPWFIDLTERPHPEFSVMHFLPEVAPALYEQLSTRFERIVAKGDR